MVLWAGVALVLALIISSVLCDAVSTCFDLFCYCFVVLCCGLVSSIWVPILVALLAKASPFTGSLTLQAHLVLGVYIYINSFAFQKRKEGKELKETASIRDGSA
jgi:F0F1-type ATP synthase membrane subunit a